MKRAFTRWIRGLVSFGLPLLLSAPGGCKRIAEQAQKAGPGADSGFSAAPGPPPVDEDQALADKLDGYIRDCVNRYSKPVRDAEEKYLSWANPKRGPTGKERNVYGIYEVPLDPQACSSAIARSNGAPPKKPDIEKLAETYSSALVVVISLINDAHGYYERGGYKDDKMARGKKLHPKLMLAFNTFDKADVELTQHLDQAQEDLDRRALVRIENEEGKKGHYYMVSTTLLAKPLLHEGTKEPPKFNGPQLTATADAFERAVDAFEAWADQNKAEASSTAGYLRAARELSTAAKSMAHRIRDKKPYSATEKSWMGTPSAWMVDGSPAALVDKYNKLIDANNAVRF